MVWPCLPQQPHRSHPFPGCSPTASHTPTPMPSVRAALCPLLHPIPHTSWTHHRSNLCFCEWLFDYYLTSSRHLVLWGQEACLFLFTVSFLTLNPDYWHFGRVTVVGGCPEHSKMLNSTPGLYPPDACRDALLWSQQVPPMHLEFQISFLVLC